MTWIKRFKNLWRLSQLESTITSDGTPIFKAPIVKIEEKPVKMAQIIRMSDPKKEFLKNEE